ncbi:hypothetical protein AVEN_75254-1 [Araneus ventricosus]|uniref:PiggyBac transposable element-derived protein domain-containing protein n=1 Tax=Araneus ventricosus TaxID=182803 RepID=A0A4Y2I7W2_ARAVE|nr:hypothetical protein AVEN_75254-1 [Araneus ventricosus]
MRTSYEEVKCLRKLLAEVETDEDSNLDNEDIRPEDILEENFSDHESFSAHDTEEDGDSGNEEVNNSEWFSSKDGVEWRKTKFRQNIRTRCHNIVSSLPGTKGTAKYATSPVKSWELFLHDNMIQLIVECTNIFIEKSALSFSFEKDARKTVPLEIRAL